MVLTVEFDDEAGDGEEVDGASEETLVGAEENEDGVVVGASVPKTTMIHARQWMRIIIGWSTEFELIQSAKIQENRRPEEVPEGSLG